MDPALSHRENGSQVNFGPLTAFLAMNQLASDGHTAITAAEPVVFVSVDCRVMVKELTLLLGHILPLVIRRIVHK